MEMLEKVEKLREKANVSYEDAKMALEACNYDMLDALVYLERLGLVQGNSVGGYTTTAGGNTSQEFEQAQQTYEKDCKKTSFGDMASRFFKWCGAMIQKGCETSFVVTRFDKEVMAIPVILLVIAALITCQLVVILLIVGLFFNFKYYFRDFESTSVDINQFCEKASETCENIKSDFQNQNKAE